MSFARPEALALLALLAPIVALFFIRPRARRSVVGSLLLWKRVESRRAAQAPLARIEKLLSLLLHAGALAALVFAIARPLASDVRPRRIVAVLDTSGSMGSRLPTGETRFEAALAQARKLAASLGPEDELGFVAAGRSPRVLLAPTRRDGIATGSRELESATLEGGTQDLRSALALAYTLLESAPASHDREVWLHSDGAAPELALEPRPSPPAGVKLRYVRLGSPRDASVGVVAFAARAVPGHPGEVAVHATLASSFKERVEATATLLLGNEPVVSERIELEPGARRELPPRRVALERGGVLALRVTTPGDVLALDDEAWLVVPPGRPPSVQVLGEGSTARFVRAALEADDGVKLATRETPPGVARSLEGPPDVLAIAGDAVPADPPRAALLVGEDAARAAAASPAWDLAVRGEATGPRAAILDPGHALLRHVLLEPVLFARAARVEPGPTWKVVAGEPPLLLVREDALGRRAVLLPFSPDESDLVLRRAWPLLVSNATAWLAGERDREGQPPVRTGEVARLTLPRRSGGSALATVFLPSGARAVVPLEVSGEEAALAFTRTSEPGVYSVFRGEVPALGAREPDARFAVGLLDEAESRVAARVDLGLGEEPALEPRPRSSTVEAASLLAGLAVLLLVLEGYLFHRRGLA